MLRLCRKKSANFFVDVLPSLNQITLGGDPYRVSKSLKSESNVTIV